MTSRESRMTERTTYDHMDATLLRDSPSMTRATSATTKCCCYTRRLGRVASACIGRHFSLGDVSCVALLVHASILLAFNSTGGAHAEFIDARVVDGPSWYRSAGDAQRASCVVDFAECRCFNCGVDLFDYPALDGCAGHRVGLGITESRGGRSLARRRELDVTAAR